VFAKRVSKAEHLRRVSAADLFLDTFLYGAHSTATDALRGGLPVITVGGGSFARRVGISLTETLGEGMADYLLYERARARARAVAAVADPPLSTPPPRYSTAKEFEDAAALLGGGEGSEVLAKIRKGLAKTWEGKLFDTAEYTRNFERMGAAMYEIKSLCVGLGRDVCGEDLDYMQLVV
jgi:predicted O-linked N-acetylglucosamine transferase (SPINDLY family)